jgi:hypothetical protein
MRAALFITLCASVGFAAEQQQFHGWSKDGSWLVYEEHGANDLVELYFCATSDAKPTWPAALNELEREASGGMSCVHFLDPNKAPWQWKAQLVLPAPANKAHGIEVLSEFSFDGDSPGFVLQAGDKKQTCFVSGLGESSKLQKTWFHASGRFVAALVNGSLAHCVVALKSGGAAKAPAPKGKGKH